MDLSSDDLQESDMLIQLYNDFQEDKKTIVLKEQPFSDKYDLPSAEKDVCEIKFTSRRIENLSLLKTPIPYREKEKLFTKEKVLQGGFLKAYLSTIQPSDPMSNSPLGHRTIGANSVNSYFGHITKSLQITPYYNKKWACIEIWWSLCHPTTVMIVLQYLANIGYTKQSLRNYYSAIYRLFWLFQNQNFCAKMNLDFEKNKPKIMKVGYWYHGNMKFAHIAGKADVIERRTRDNMRWEEPHKFQQLLLNIEKRLLEKKKISFVELRQMVVFCFFVSIPPARPQNAQLLVVKSSEKRACELERQVANYNKQLSFKDLQGCCCTGVIFENPNEQGDYEVRWFTYKTSGSYHNQTRFFFHPATKLVLEQYFKRRPNKDQKVFLQTKDGNPMNNPGKDFQNFCEKAFGKGQNISVSDYRIITSTKIGEFSEEEQNKMAEAQLHDPKTAKTYYNKPLESPQRKTYQRLMTAMGDTQGEELTYYSEQIDKLMENIVFDERKRAFEEVSAILKKYPPIKKRKFSSNSTFQKAKKYACSDCLESFDTKKKHDNHVRYHHKPVKCSVCSELLIGGKEADDHCGQRKRKRRKRR